MNHSINYLKKMTIENFQSHIKTTIEPAPPGQLTVITGPSDSGKTAILRALRWLFVNEPDGDSFIRASATFARVTAEYEGGGVVVRHRTSGGTNRYIVNGEKFEGFGRSGVPLEVKEITGVRPVKIGDMELNLNIAEQLSGPFLGSSVSAPARAKVLGKLAGTEEIDYANRILGTDLHRRGQDEKRLAGELEELKEKIKEYDWLPEAARKIEALESIVERVKKNQAVRNRLIELVERIEQLNEKITVAQATLYRWRNLEQAEEFTANVAENQRSKDLLVKLVNNYWTYQKSIWSCEKVIAKYSALPEAEKKLRAAQDGVDRARKLRDLKAGYLSAQETIQKNQEILSNLHGIDRAGELAASIQEKITRRDILLRLARSYGSTGMLIAQEQVKVKTLQQVAEAEKFLQAAVEKRDNWEKLVVLHDKYTSLSGLIEDARAKVVMWENRVAELQGAYQDELAAAGICPLCGQAIDYQKIKEAV